MKEDYSQLFTPFPILETDRLELIQLKEAFADQLFSIRTNPNINRYIDRTPPSSLVDVKQFITKINAGFSEGNWIYWGIWLKAQSKLIGTVCLWNFSKDRLIAEIGYELLPSFTGKGYMYEAVNTLLPFAFKHAGLNQVEAYTHSDNSPSIKLLAGTGFEYKRHFKEKNSVQGVESTSVIYLISR